MSCVLVVDDDHNHAQSLRRLLHEQQFTLVDIAADGEQALRFAHRAKYDLIILELMVPKLDGIGLVRRLRDSGFTVPVLVLSFRDSVTDRVEALLAGADDHVSKHTDVREVLARVRALLRRPHSQMMRLQVADLEIDCLQHTVRRGSRRIELCKKEFAILEYLMRNTAYPVSREMLVSHVWDGSFEGMPSTVDVHICHLRRKIDHGSAKQLIHTVRGVGYLIQDADALNPAPQTVALSSFSQAA